jgi:DNA polymerase
MSAQNELRKIAEEIAKCEDCKKNKFGLPVPGEGKPDAEIMLVGESPGPNEAKVGRPFVGRSGKFLDTLLQSIALKRKEIFITSPIKYYPGKRAPTNEEIEHGKTHLLKQVAAVNPKIIVLLGNIAIKTMLGGKFTASKIHGKIFHKNGRIYFATFHPAAAMRFPKIRAKTKKDFNKLKKIISNLWKNANTNR